jgi:hypothetical protein
VIFIRRKLGDSCAAAIRSKHYYDVPQEEAHAVKHVAQYPSRRRPGPLRNSSVKEENGLAIASSNGLRFDAATKSPPPPPAPFS